MIIMIMLLIYIYIYVYVHMYMYIYIYREREREIPLLKWIVSGAVCDLREMIPRCRGARSCKEWPGCHGTSDQRGSGPATPGGWDAQPPPVTSLSLAISFSLSLSLSLALALANAAQGAKCIRRHRDILVSITQRMI